MNQILDYNPNKSSGGGSSGSDKIVRVFAVILIIFAVCLLGSGAYGLYKKNAEKSEPTATPTKAKITVEQQETEAVIKVNHDKAIEKIIYSWDNEKEINNKGNGESSMEIKVALLAGEHTLNVKVTDIDGVESNYEEVITSENGEDKIYPVIALKVDSVTKKLIVTVTDETAIDFVTYRWNNEKEKEIKAEEEEQKELEFEIEILKGQNDLTIIAVDKNNNSTTETKTFSGVTKPDITITVAADKKTVDIACFHENGLTDLKLKLNGEEYDLNYLVEDKPKETAFVIDLFEGENNLEVTAKSIDDTETVATETVVTETEEIPTLPSDEIMEININQLEEDPSKIEVVAKCENGLKEITLNVNGQEYFSEIENLPEVMVPLDLEEGTNKIKVTIVSSNGSEKTEEKEITR